MSITFQVTESSPREAVNFSNVNACAMLALLGLALEPAGGVAPAAVPSVVARLLRLANLDRLRAPATHDGESSDSGRYVVAAQTDAMVRRRAIELLAVFAAAQRRGCGVDWG